MKARRGLACAALLSGLAGYPPRRPSASFWRPEDRVVISDFSWIEAVAASPFYVFAATAHGLTIYDRRSHRWQLPVTAVDGYPSARIRVALADAVDNGVWLGTDLGWARYDPDLHQWESGTVPGGVSSLMLDAGDQASGVFVETGFSGWQFLPRGGAIPEPGRPLPPVGRRIQALDPRAAIALAPTAQSMRALMLTDQRLRSYQFTSAARSLDQPEVYFGTNGMGVLEVDPNTGQYQRLTTGILTASAGAVALGPDGVWVAANSRAGDRRGIAWVSRDLGEMTGEEDATGRISGVLVTRKLLASGRNLYLATDRGLFVVDNGSYQSRLLDAGSGLPADQVLALAPAPDGVWAGTARGLAVVSAGGKAQPFPTLPQAITALAVLRDTLWVGSAVGMGVLAPGSDQAVVTRELDQAPSLKTTILALTRTADTLVLATANELAWRDPAGAWHVSRGRGDLGTVTSLAGDSGGVWIGGTTGLAFWNLGSGAVKALHVPDDIPAAVRDVAVQGEYLWVATDSGLVRLSRDAARNR